MGKVSAVAGFAILGLCAAVYAAHPEIPATPPMAAAQAARMKATDFQLVAIDGAPLPLKKFKGQVVLLVNTASFCGFTPQYEALQKIQTEYKPKGFTVLGVPSADFGGQEYAKNSEIAGFCKSKFGINFPLTEKSDVVGPQAIPIYKWAAAKMGADNTPKWNFHKYLIGKNGQIVAAFGSKATPDSPEVRAAIEGALKKG
ncbi:glutathione peroxidase [Sphingomonas naphthae]|uniref:Glutathione peroxidase n=1 Tax=Sphingomonas naphthae TaxID=1813468 RepID=A0ABY7TLG8_9SPHN|nr:glutathione peroxidase [Sphingomonas naphthae]WCT73542.1 glutathione peroxidase [Sphingomonas naphthae]